MFDKYFHLVKKVKIFSKHTEHQIPNKRGYGTGEQAVAGVVERNGQIVLRGAERLTSKFLLGMLQSHVKTNNAIVMTGEFKGYNKFDEFG
jgi:transposase-like protein